VFRYIKLAGILAAVLGLALTGCQNAIDPVDETNQISSPNFATAFSSEQLIDIDIPLAEGSGFVAAGTGLRGDPSTAQPGTINLNVPGEVKQVILYWEGQMTSAVGDDEITVNGIPVTGTLLGGPTNFFEDAWSTAYRADITGLGEVATGSNTILIGGMDYNRGCPDCRNNGAGVLVIYDDGSGAANLAVKDGLDLAYFNFDPPLDTTEPVTFNFAASTETRTASLWLFAASVASNRPNVVTVNIDGSLQRYVDPFQSFEGPDWDTVELTFDVPAGATTVTVQALSEKDGTSTLDGLPASLGWLTAALEIASVIEPPPPPPGGDGCTPGYWKNHEEDWAVTGYALDDDFDAIFGTDYFDPDMILFDAVWHGGGGKWRLGRHGTAALLSAAHPDVAYGLTVDEVINAVQNGDADLLEYHNELGCPLGRGDDGPQKMTR
jgi:hypothetical protein